MNSESIKITIRPVDGPMKDIWLKAISVNNSNFSIVEIICGNNQKFDERLQHNGNFIFIASGSGNNFYRLIYPISSPINFSEWL